nr:DUF4236 domain-containing protein [uncultured Clostridium sp.]
MGLRVRRSINLGGGFRINLSKSGVGYSWGVPGYRVTQTARGKTRKTYSIPGTGISYVEEGGNKKKVNSAQSKQNHHDSYQISDMEEIVSADIENFQPAEYADLLKKLQATLLWNKISTWLCLCLIIFTNPLFIILGLIGIALKIYIHTQGKIELNYEFDVESKSKYEQKIASWKSLNSCNKLWQINQSGKVNNTKTTGGASNMVNRSLFIIGTKSPWYIKCNVEIIVLAFKTESLIVLPDKLLLIKGKKVGAINYENIKYNIYANGFLEDEQPPKDSEFVRYVWKYTNKDGSPDKRYNGNKQIPVYKYGRIDLSSPEGLNAKIMCSNEKIAEQFKNRILIN